VDGDQVSHPVQFRGQGLDGRHHEQGVGEPAARGPGGCPPRHGHHPGRVGVDADDQPVGLRGGRGQHVAAVAGSQVDGGRRVLAGQLLESADIHVPQPPAHHRAHRWRWS
jgi:hypothetical protein